MDEDQIPGQMTIDECIADAELEAALKCPCPGQIHFCEDCPNDVAA